MSKPGCSPIGVVHGDVDYSKPRTLEELCAGVFHKFRVDLTQLVLNGAVHAPNAESAESVKPEPDGIDSVVLVGHPSDLNGEESR